MAKKLVTVVIISMVSMTLATTSGSPCPPVMMVLFLIGTASMGTVGVGADEGTLLAGTVLAGIVLPGIALVGAALVVLVAGNDRNGRARLDVKPNGGTALAVVPDMLLRLDILVMLVRPTALLPLLDRGGMVPIFLNETLVKSPLALPRLSSLDTHAALLPISPMAYIT